MPTQTPSESASLPTAGGDQLQALTFYQYLGVHSLLIGLLPFYLPVFLWQHGFTLAELCLLIGSTGLAFCLALSGWQWVARVQSTRRLLVLSFAAELALIACVWWWFPDSDSAIDSAQNEFRLVLPAVTIGLVNGIYNAFFWTTQRALFVQLLRADSSGSSSAGRQYGNFQIFVTVFLKIGILLGGLLLDAGGLVWLLLLSAVIGAAASWWFMRSLPLEPLLDLPHVPFRHSLWFRDRQGSATTFVVDGFFLFLESHFWTLSLFLLVGEDFSRMGVAVVILALVFAALFFVLKNAIDRLSTGLPYVLGVALYAVSWLMRATVDAELSMQWLLALLIAITFCSSFFRLTFNKRFFDLARQLNTSEVAQQAGKDTHTHAIRYLLHKSRASQFWLGMGFLAAGALLLRVHIDHDTVLRWSYVVAACASLAYLSYRLHTPALSRQLPQE